MARDSIGTVTDEERLVPLYASGDAFYVDVSEPIRTANLPEGGPFAWRLLEEGDAPRLALAPVDDPAEAGDLYTAELSAADETLTIDVPEALLAGGLDLDVDEYDDDAPLLFEPDELEDGVAVGMTPREEPGGTVRRGIELLPLRFADGTPFRPGGADEPSVESDPVAEAELAREGAEETPARSGAIDAPIDAPVVDAILESSSAPRADVVDALETISRRNLVAEPDDDSPYDPLVIDDERVLIALDEETWNAVVRRLDADNAALDAVLAIHERQAEELLRPEFDWKRFEGRIPLVIEPGRTG